jgi:autotransporter passenger strand-loop-strand repeat protein
MSDRRHNPAICGLGTMLQSKNSAWYDVGFSLLDSVRIFDATSEPHSTLLPKIFGRRGHAASITTRVIVGTVTWGLGGDAVEVSADGTDFGAIISGGERDVFGSANRAIIFTGGLQIVEAGGTASGTVISSGGSEFVFSGGTGGATISIGGFAAGSSGGLVVSASVGSVPFDPQDGNLSPLGGTPRADVICETNTAR